MKYCQQNTTQVKWWMVAISISPIGAGSDFTFDSTNRTIRVLAHVSILVTSCLRDATVGSLSSLDLTKNIMMASYAHKMTWLFLFLFLFLFVRLFVCLFVCLLILRDVNEDDKQEGLIWSFEVPRH